MRDIEEHASLTEGEIIDKETVDAAREQLIEILKETRDETGKSSAMTSAELKESLGWPDKRVRDKLKEGIKRGIIKVEFVYRRNIAGVNQRIPGYKIAETKEENYG